MQAIILAAGESSRFWPLSEKKHKSLVKIVGKSLIEWTIESLGRANIKDIIIIQSPSAELEKHLGDGSAFGANISYRVQKEAKGMGNAVMLAEPLIKEDSFFVLNPYAFNAEDFIALMSAKQKDSGAKMVLLGVKTDKPWNYGMLGLKEDKVVSIIEKPLQGQEPSDVKATNIYLLPKEFFDYYRKVEEQTYAFEDALSLYMKENDVRLVMSENDTPSLKYPWDLFKINEIIMNTLIKKKRVSKTAKVSKSAIIEGPVWICDNAIVFEHAVIKGPAYIGKGCIIGNNALIRKYTDLEDGVLVGANAEVTRSIFQPLSHIHSGFFGDSIIGNNARIGAGTITANVRMDRKEIQPTVKGEKVETKLTSLGAVIGDDTHLGTAVNTMPGILIGADSKIGPNSLIRENVPSETVCYTEFKNIVKKNTKNKEV
ncbi:MAG: bifunctional sugar-1-phosphate nucleotidylyltransferase/acetyltransferase [Candidatus Paceibacterota bacterium]|jgi:bifunctional UDP-N-acetylglucosamine pyrophosphorylase/glucosamine-1-phosphate N-acetyltransferase